MHSRVGVLVTGGTGFIGRPLCSRLIAEGFVLRGAVRSQSSVPDGVESVAVGDIDGETNWQRALVGCDAVVHLAARVHVMQEASADPLAEFRRFNVHGTLNLARQAAAAGVRPGCKSLDVSDYLFPRICCLKSANWRI